MAKDQTSAPSGTCHELESSTSSQATHPDLETSQTIKRWGDETFGPLRGLEALTQRAGLEFEELCEAVSNKEPDRAIGAEAADVVILLHRLMGTLGMDLNEEVNRKMRINRKRKWALKADGTGRHIE